MKRRPRKPSKDKLVNLKLLFFSTVIIGTIQAVAGFVSYFTAMDSFGFAPSDLLWKAQDYFNDEAGPLTIGNKVYVSILHYHGYIFIIH
jgi:hypothetical protein